MAQAVPGNGEAFKAFFARYKDALYDYALRMLGCPDNAADIVQEVFIRLYRTMQNGEVITTPKNWLYSVARNLCLNHIRDGKKNVSLERFADIPAKDSPDTVDTKFHLRQALSRLRDDYREALILKEYHGFSYAEIAAIMQVTIPAVRSLLYKARIALKETFMEVKIER